MKINIDTYADTCETPSFLHREKIYQQHVQLCRKMCTQICTERGGRINYRISNIQFNSIFFSAKILDMRLKERHSKAWHHKEERT